MASAGAVIFFVFIALASIPALFGSADYLEGPCTQLTPISQSYVINIKVIDGITGIGIPNATVEMDFLHATHEYLGNSKCKISPAINKHQIITRQTNADGIATFETYPLLYNVSVDFSSIYISASAQHYTVSQKSAELSPGSPTANIECILFNLNNEP